MDFSSESVIVVMTVPLKTSGWHPRQGVAASRQFVAYQANAVLNRT
jgi:hypothetical protein